MTDPIFTTPVADPFGLPNMGTTVSRLSLADIDGDGDLDLFVGLGTGNTDFYRNTGTLLAPVFALEGGNFGLTNVGFKASPWLVDIDGDGDLDAFVGAYSGITQFFRNTGTGTAPVFASEAGNFGLPDIGASASLVFVDIDADGDQDAFIGDVTGQTSFFLNTGTATAPAFSAGASNFGIPDVGLSATPTFADIDADGDLDAFVGNLDGITQFFRNTGSATAPAFASATSNFGITDFGTHANPTLADIDGDGDQDAFVSGADGGVRFFRNTAPGIHLTQSGGSTAVTEGGLTDSYTVVLNRAPLADVTITLGTSNHQVALNATSLIFTSSNWNVAQTVSISAVNDTVGEGAHTGAVLHAVSSADAAYNGMAVKPVQVAIRDDDLPVAGPVFGSPLVNPWGLVNTGIIANIEIADLDGDGDLDALVSEGYGSTRLYRNTGNASAPAFTREEADLGLTNLETFPDPALGDLDGDGDLDAFIGLGTGAITFFRNTGTAASPVFVSEASNLGLGSVDNFATPTLVDIDGDGDLDAFVGGFDGNTRFFLNTGGPTNPVFQLQANNFGLTDIGAAADPTFADIDADGDMDALIGETYSSVKLFRNTGTSTAPTFVQDLNGIGLDSASPIDNPYASPDLADIDADGDLDALVSDENGTVRWFINNLPGVQITQSSTTTEVSEGGVADSYTVALKSAPGANVTITLGGTNQQVVASASTLTFTSANWNVPQTVHVIAVDDSVGEGPHAGAIQHTVSSTDGVYNGMVVRPVSVAVTDNDLPALDPLFGTPVLQAFGLSDVGESVVPVFADIDADGDQDAFVGTVNGTTTFFRNTGSPTAPVFSAEAGNFGLTNPAGYAAPALVDIDGDGDVDAFIGFIDGVTRLFRNTGSASAPAFTREAGPLDLVVAGTYAQPTFADIDGDGDLDAFVGNYGTTGLQFFRNMGSTTAPSFVAESSSLGITNTQRFPSPRLVDLDGDGDQDLVSGRDGVDLNLPPLIYRNVGTASSAGFVLEQNGFGLTNIGQYTRPTFVDLDADGDQDAVAGDIGGNLAFFANSAPGVQIRQSDGSTAVTEGGATDSYSVQLRSAPVANVTITLDTTSHQVGTSVGTLTFTPANWNVAQTVTVTALDDKLGEGAHSGVIRHAVTSTDGTYNGMAVTPLRVAVTDNDRPFAAPNFTVGDVNPFGIVSQAAHSAPVLADIDADGDLDVFVGYTDGTVRLFRNTGSVTAPTYTLQAGDIGLVDVGDEAGIALADVDGDGDLDAFLGSLQGTTRYFRNVGSASSANFVEELNGIWIGDVGASSRPAFADIDGDGDFDLFVGNSVGEVWFHRNVGSVGEPLFQMASLAADNFGLGKVAAMASPSFADLDGDGDMDAVVGDQDGAANVYIKVGTAQAPKFLYIANGQTGLGDVGYASAPTFADIDGDGDLDALVGNLVGGTRLYLGQGTLALAPLAGISLIDTPRDDSFASTSLSLNAVGADGAAVTYGIQGGSVNGATVSLGTSYGVLTVTRATGAATFTPTKAAIDPLDTSASVAVTVTATDGASTATQVLTITIGQSGTTETTGNDTLGGTAGDERFDGLAGNDSISGLAGNDTLAGGAGDDILDGGIGADSLVGGDGNDTFYVDNTGDVATESNAVLATGGNDRVYSSVTCSLGANVENLYLTGTGSITGMGNALANYIEGNAGATNYLSGGAGADTMSGGDGNDVYYVDDATDVVIETNALAAGGTDTVVATVTFSAGPNIENILFSGSAGTTGVGNGLANYIEGNAAQNYLFGGAGTDTMKGNDGNDIYYVDSSTDVVIETNALAAGGTDTVVSSVTYSLGANLEQLLLGGSAAITGIGNATANYIEGNSAQNYLSGGAGNDTMKGLDGNDVYYVDASTDVVIETNTDPVSGGVDFVVSTVTYSLGANVENLLLDGTAPITGIGSAVNNYIEGNSAANFISGGLGADTMKGNDGNDVYYVDNIGDVVIETNAVLTTGGRDTISSSIAYALGANVEDLLLSGVAAIGGLGNGLANYMTGNTAANALSGQDGNDTLIGGTGTDTLTGGLGADTFDFNALLESLVGASRDVITDFSSAQGDRVDLAGIDANSTLASDQAFSFIGAAAFSSVAGQLRFVGNILSGDTDGNGSADFEIQLTGVASLAAGDFAL